jgi:hypothetical protein
MAAAPGVLTGLLENHLWDSTMQTPIYSHNVIAVSQVTE